MSRARWIVWAALLLPGCFTGRSAERPALEHAMSRVWIDARPPDGGCTRVGTFDVRRWWRGLESGEDSTDVAYRAIRQEAVLRHATWVQLGALSAPGNWVRATGTLFACPGPAPSPSPTPPRA
jgi:hypothetical protein